MKHVTFHASRTAVVKHVSSILLAFSSYGPFFVCVYVILYDDIDPERINLDKHSCFRTDGTLPQANELAKKRKHAKYTIRYDMARYMRRPINEMSFSFYLI
mmetsp:Transcript_10085/g.21349  ORF Transcript_10085/g.21349 Transcript_10085/m.21349 type:complete len:101 (+) Transcript_10085:1779-2081(+)